MSTHRHLDRICCVVLVLTLMLTALFANAAQLGVQAASTVMGYESKLFDTSRVHTIDILMDDWDAFIADCQSEAYTACTVVIDNEAYQNVAIRGKGNTSLTQVAAYGNNRYSFKIEFDHYDSTNTYYGLDKLCLNNIIQDNTYMKDYLCYQMMGQMGVASPLCSYVYITVNGEDWGLYLAVEGVEESFLQRSYGSDYGALYKPDSQSMGGGRGNGEGFDINAFLDGAENAGIPGRTNGISGDAGSETFPQKPGGMQNGQMPGGRMGSGSDDVLLKYIDDEIESYSNIFDNAKTAVTDGDKTRLIQSLKQLSAGENLESVVDIDAVIRYFVVHNFVLNFDSYTGSMIHNYYLYEQGGQMQMIPWDYNLAFGGFQSAGSAESLVNYPIDSPVSGGDVQDRPMLAWIFENEEYTQLYHRYFSEFLSLYFDSGYFAEMIDSVTSMISPYVEKDPTKFCTYAEFETGAATLREFCLLRARSVRGQLDGTIGATSDTQQSDTLIDADDLQISAMGAMGNNMGGGREQPGGNMQDPQGNITSNVTQQFPSFGGDIETPDSLPEAPITERNATGDNAAQQMPGGQMQGGAPPDFANGEKIDIERGSFGGEMQQSDGNTRPDDNGQMIPQTQTTVSVTAWGLIGVSVFALALGLCCALFYKRRK